MNHLQLYEKYKRNIKHRIKKGYTPIYKDGYFKILFVDAVPSKQREIEFPREYTTDVAFLETFAKKIGAELVYDDHRKHKPLIDKGDYVVFKTETGNEKNCLKIAGKYNFVIDSDLYDDKSDKISQLFDDLYYEMSDIKDEFNEISDDELKTTINGYIDTLNSILKLI